MALLLLVSLQCCTGAESTLCRVDHRHITHGAGAPMCMCAGPFSAPEQVPGWAWRQQPLRILPHKPQIHPKKGSIFTEIWAAHVLNHLQPASPAYPLVDRHCGANTAKWGEGLSSNTLSPLFRAGAGARMGVATPTTANFTARAQRSSKKKGSSSPHSGQPT